MDWENILTAICSFLGAGGVTALSMKSLIRKIIKDIESSKDVYAALRTGVEERMALCEKKVEKIDTEYKSLVSMTEKTLGTLRELLANRLCDNFEKIEESLKNRELEKMLWVSTLEMYERYRANGWNHYIKDHYETLIRHIKDICPNFEDKLNAVQLKESIKI